MSLMNRVLATFLVAGVATAMAVEADSRPWIGVSLSPVTGAVAKHIGLAENEGLMISNVAEDSPAMAAGIEQYDVVVSLNGEPVSSDFGEFSGRVADIGVGNVATLDIVRGGTRSTIDVALGEMPEPQQIRYSYQNMPDVVTQYDTGVFGKIVEQDDQGNWIVKDLGELDKLDGVLNRLDDSMGKIDAQFFADPNFSGKMRFNFFTNNDDQNQSSIVESENGKSITVEVDSDGLITVSRRDETNPDNVVETLESYDTEEALQNADDEAYELYKQLPNNTGLFAYRFPNIDIQVQDGAAARKAVDEVQAAMQQALQQTGNLQGQLLPKIRHFHQADQNSYQNWPNAYSAQWVAKPATTFDQKSDGSIVVKTHKGDTLLTREYSSEADFEQRDPDLYAKYRELLDAAE